MRGDRARLYTAMLSANGSDEEPATIILHRRVTPRVVLVGVILLSLIAVGVTLGIVLPGTKESANAVRTGGDASAPTLIATTTTRTGMTPTIVPATTQTTTSATTQMTPVVNASTLPPGSGPYVCTGDDRHNHEEPLYSGQVLCSRNQQYVFGMHSDGRFIKWDVIDSNGKHDVFYTGNPGDWYILRVDGTIEIYNLRNELQWKRDAKFDMNFAKCLTEYACPYMHLHNDGVLVLNHRDASGTWKVRRLKEAYDL